MTETWPETAIAVLLGFGLLGSTLVWDSVRRRRWLRLPVLPAGAPPQAPVPLPVLLAVIGWMAFNVMMQLLASTAARPVISVAAVKLMFGIHLAIAVLLFLALTEGFRRRLADAGLSAARFPRQILTGAAAFLAVVWPTVILLAISALWRNEQTQHDYLAALREAPGFELIFWIVVSGVVGAPLAEELLFRVVLQGWLGERLPAMWAIGATAVVFALAHGWRDALPLLPFSVIIGYVYHRTRWYFASVTMHALFNGSNLTMALLALAIPPDNAP